MSLPSCIAYDVDKSQRPIYAKVLGREVITRRPMAVYVLDSYGNCNYHDDRHYLGYDKINPPEVSAYIPEGNSVHFSKAVEHRDMGSTGGACLEGILTIDGTTYHVFFNTDSSEVDGYPNPFNHYFKVTE